MITYNAIFGRLDKTKHLWFFNTYGIIQHTEIRFIQSMVWLIHEGVWEIKWNIINTIKRRTLKVTHTAHVEPECLFWTKIQLVSHLQDGARMS